MPGLLVRTGTGKIVTRRKRIVTDECIDVCCGPQTFDDCDEFFAAVNGGTFPSTLTVSLSGFDTYGGLGECVFDCDIAVEFGASNYYSADPVTGCESTGTCSGSDCIINRVRLACYDHDDLDLPACCSTPPTGSGLVFIMEVKGNIESACTGGGDVAFFWYFYALDNPLGAWTWLCNGDVFGCDAGQWPGSVSVS